jgi:hypothetical protein
MGTRLAIFPITHLLQNQVKGSSVLSAWENGVLVWAKQFVGVIAILTGLGFVGAIARAQSDEGSMRPGRVHASGILEDRISPRDFRRWDAIKRIVFAEDFTGLPLHPTLRSLWEQLDRSGHAIYIELCCKTPGLSTTAGTFRIELFDPLGIRHVAAIRLYPATIDLASIGLAAARPNGFIPFKGLTREERYAEVLGHELAHAVHILSDLTRARMVEEMIEQTNDEFLLQSRRYGYANLNPEILQRIERRDLLLRELEEPAERMERMIWSEIVAGRRCQGSIAVFRNFLQPY